MVSRIEADGCEVAEGAHGLPFIRGANRVAAVFNQPKVVLPGECGDRIEIEGIAQRVSQHDGLGALAQGFLKLADIDVVSRNGYVYKNRHQSILNDRVDCGWKASCDSDDFIAGPELPLA